MMAFLERARWEGKVFTTDGWAAGSGGEHDAVEPATGATLARVGESGTGSRHGGTQANLDAFTEVQWVTVRGDLPQYPF
jgi:hypothetical protein